MPIDVNSWRAGIANTKYCYFLHVKQQSNGTFSDYSISILRIFIYLYVFIISSLATGSLSVCATVILNVFRFQKLSLSPWSNKNTLILSYSLRTFIGVETAALTFRTKQYSTSYSSHICYGKRFYNDFFLNHHTIALVNICLKLLTCVVIETALDLMKKNQ